MKTINTISGYILEYDGGEKTDFHKAQEDELSKYCTGDDLNKIAASINNTITELSGLQIPDTLSDFPEYTIITDDINNLSSNLDYLSGRIDSNYTTLNDKTDNKITTLSTTISGNTTDITALSGVINNNINTLTILSGDINNNRTNIATNTTNITVLSGVIDNNRTNIVTNTDNITVLSSAIDNNRTNIATNTSNIATNATEILTNRNKIDTNTDNITLLSSAINERDERIDVLSGVVINNVNKLNGLTSDINNNLTKSISANTAKINQLEISKQDSPRYNTENIVTFTETDFISEEGITIPSAGYLLVNNWYINGTDHSVVTDPFMLYINNIPIYYYQVYYSQNTPKMVSDPCLMLPVNSDDKIFAKLLTPTSESDYSEIYKLCRLILKINTIDDGLVEEEPEPPSGWEGMPELPEDDGNSTEGGENVENESIRFWPVNRD